MKIKSVKQFIAIIFCLGVCTQAHAQYPVHESVRNASQYKDTMITSVNDYLEKRHDEYLALNEELIGGKSPLIQKRIIMPKPYFDKFIGKYFSYAATNKPGLPDGNSISITPTSNSTRLEANLSKRSDWAIFNAGLKANMSDNIANLFSSNDISANTTFYLNFSFLRKRHSVIGFDANKVVSGNDDKIQRINQFKNDFNQKYKMEYVKDSLHYQELLSQLQHLDTLYNKEPDTNVKDSLNSKIINLKKDFSTSIQKLRSYGLNDWEANIASDYNQEWTNGFKDSINQILEEMELNNTAWTNLRFSWFSVGGTYTKQQYKTYDSLLTFAERINDLPFNNVGLTLGFNYFSQYSATGLILEPVAKSFYFNAAYSIVNDLNYAHVDEQDVVTLNQVGDGDTVYQFQKASKVRDITRLSKRESWQHTFSAQSTIVFRNSNFVGFNTAVSGSYGRFNGPIYSGKLGLLFRFINSADLKSKLNFELFLQLTDWNDSNGSGKSTWQRKAVGFNTTIPFDKLFF